MGDSNVDALATFLDDADQLRIWIPEEDDARWEDPDDHGDPMVERWGRNLAGLGPEIAVAATIACADAITVAWTIDVGTSTIDEAIDAARSSNRIDAALARLAIDDALVKWAHTRDVWAAARCALVAARNPARASDELRSAALFAYRVIGWSRHCVTNGERALTNKLASFAAEGTDDADRCRQTLRRVLRAALIG